MKIFNKKAIAPKFLAELIIAIVIGVAVLLIVFTPTAKAVSEKGFGDELCHVNAGLINAASGIGGRFFLFFCTEQRVTIDADDDKTCDGLTDAKSCASEQFANLVERCWYRYGQGKWNVAVGGLTQHDCFRAKVQDLAAANVVKEIDITKQLDCKFIANNECTTTISGDPCEKLCGNADQLICTNDPVLATAGCEIKTQQTWLIQYHEGIPDRVEIVPP